MLQNVFYRSQYKHITNIICRYGTQYLPGNLTIKLSMTFIVAKILRRPTFQIS